ncbi:hypothetical protein ACFXB3_14460 [Streptomyces sp. NPDC059447]|uniref:hypothetical protein n=1 Tax=Streptomyces sp. NPDC059447 TaxID=3346834 RepID=UPI00367422C8
MPIDPYAALNAMLRAEAARFAPPARQNEPARPARPVQPVQPVQPGQPLQPVQPVGSDREREQNGTAPADPAA